jgi:hypothetical protein
MLVRLSDLCINKKFFFWDELEYVISRSILTVFVDKKLVAD